jgi:hypothetical protein
MRFRRDGRVGCAHRERLGASIGNSAVGRAHPTLAIDSELGADEMSTDFNDQHLLAYLDENLAVDEMSAVEASLRRSEALRRRVGLLARRRDHGGHSVGDVWRRRRISCPDRGELGSYLLGVLDPERAGYVTFHVNEVGCRYCQANLNDLERAAAERDEVPVRRRRYFESSAGLLKASDESSGANRR